jgi:hypothetical protein
LPEDAFLVLKPPNPIYILIQHKNIL